MQHDYMIKPWWNMVCRVPWSYALTLWDQLRALIRPQYSSGGKPCWCTLSNAVQSYGLVWVASSFIIIVLEYNSPATKLHYMSIFSPKQIELITEPELTSSRELQEMWKIQGNYQAYHSQVTFIQEGNQRKELVQCCRNTCWPAA